MKKNTKSIIIAFLACAISGVVICAIWIFYHSSEIKIAANTFVMGDGFLDAAIVDESYVDKRIVVGMKQKDIEGLIGPPYEIDTYLGSVRHKYKLKYNAPTYKGERFLGFDLIYDKTYILMAINKSWSGG